MNRIEWIDLLCSRFKHILQVDFSKEFTYDFQLAEQATMSSIIMLSKGHADHFLPLYYPTRAEAVAFSNVRGNDENALRNMSRLFREHEPHAKLLRNNNFVGIGFSYCQDNDRLYSSVRLR